MVGHRDASRKTTRHIITSLERTRIDTAIFEVLIRD